MIVLWPSGAYELVCASWLAFVFYLFGAYLGGFSLGFTVHSSGFKVASVAFQASDFVTLAA